MYKALEVEFIISKTMLIMINGENKREAKHESVRIKWMVLDLHDVTVDIWIWWYMNMIFEYV